MTSQPCLICGVMPKRLHRDHCHRHDRQRGRVCPRCNGLMRYLDQGKPPQVTPELLRNLTEHAARCPDCAAGNPASASGGYILHVQISDDLAKFLRAYADSRGISIAAAVRILLHDRMAQERKEK